jgi:hypothetical protein
LGMWDGPRPFFHILKNHLIKKIYQLWITVTVP